MINYIYQYHHCLFLFLIITRILVTIFNRINTYKSVNRCVLSSLLLVTLFKTFMCICLYRFSSIYTSSIYIRKQVYMNDVFSPSSNSIMWCRPTDKKNKTIEYLVYTYNISYLYKFKTKFEVDKVGIISYWPNIFIIIWH